MIHTTYEVQIKDDQAWGGWAEHSWHSTEEEAMEEYNDFKWSDRKVRVVEVVRQVKVIHE
jgi:hypothetical protein